MYMNLNEIKNRNLNDLESQEEDELNKSPKRCMNCASKPLTGIYI